MPEFIRKRTVLIAGFPGVGKTYAYDQLVQEGYLVTDSDSSLFPKDNFPENYVSHIVKLMNEEEPLDFIFISTHEEVRNALTAAGIEYTLVYPGQNMKEVYMKRYAERGSPQGFLDQMEKKWDQFVESVAMDSQERHIILDSITTHLLMAIRHVILKI